MDTEKYQGWTNHATWMVALHLSNSQWTQSAMQEMANEWWEKQVEEGENPRESMHKLGDSMREWLESAIEDTGAVYKRNPTDIELLLQDMVGSVLSDVSWQEIAKSYCDELEVWMAGWNMPGYMPDNEPATFASFKAAYEYICEELTRYAEDLAERGEMGEAEEILQPPCNHEEFEVRAGEYVWWVSKA